MPRYACKFFLERMLPESVFWSGAIVHSLVLAAGKQLEKVACVFS